MYTEQLTQALLFGTPTAPVAKTASFNSGSIDLQNCKRALFLIALGAVSGTTLTLDGKLQESTDNSTFTDLSGTGVTITQLTAGGNKVVSVEVRGDQVTKRYVRLAFTIGGTSPSFTMAVVPLGCEAAFKPANANNDAAVVEQKVVS